MNEVANTRKWWASALMIGAVVGLACLLIGALGAKLGMWGFQTGFLFLAVGVILATLCFFLGVIAFVLCTVKGFKAERGAVLTGVIISVVILALMGNQYSQAQAVPPIHNITTDTENPPQFDKIVALREAGQANPLPLTDEVIEAQKKAYPQLRSLVSTDSQAAMVAKAAQVVEQMGMELVATDTTQGLVEATDTTFWFGFKDDVVIRVLPEGSGSVVDVRSVSRVGQSDLGKNAQRISEILAALGAN